MWGYSQGKGGGKSYIQKTKEEGLSEFEANLSYTVSSNPAWATYSKMSSQNNQINKSKKES